MEITAQTVTSPDKRTAHGVVKARAKNAHSIRVTISEDIAAALDVQSGDLVHVHFGFMRPWRVSIVKLENDAPGAVKTYQPKRSKQVYLTLSLKNTCFTPPSEPIKIPHELKSPTLALDLSALRVKDSASPTLPQGEDNGRRSN